MQAKSDAIETMSSAAEVTSALCSRTFEMIRAFSCA